MKIVFIMRHSGYVRNFESTLRMLCARGHDVHLAFHTTTRRWLADATDIPQQLAAEYRNFSCGMAPVRMDGWGLLGRELRLGLDYLRYLSPPYLHATKLRRRAEADVDEAILRAAKRGPVSRWWLAHLLRLLDRSIPRSAEIDRFMDHHRPDLLLVTPLVERGSPQSDYVRSAQARGIRTVFCVASWDNLTNKGLIHEQFDLITVWNEAMKREAVELHGASPDRIVVTGAQPFDHWFGRQPSTSREAFCARVGLRHDRPYLLYLCSSKFIADNEAPFVRRWVRQLRESSSEALRESGVLVRPHPQNARQWARFDAADLTNFVIFPRAGAAPVDAASRADYFDSIYHSAAVVGVNTTAEIESAIVGRSVYSFLAPEFRETQEGTLHFQHLRRGEGGLVHVADNVADHMAQLEAAFRPGDDRRLRMFVESFVRPHGAGMSATEELVEALEQLPVRYAPRRVPMAAWAAPFARPLLRRLAAQARRKAIDAAAEKARRAKIRHTKRKVRAEQRRARLAERARTGSNGPAKAPTREIAGDEPGTTTAALDPPPPPSSSAVATNEPRSALVRRKRRRLSGVIQGFQELSHMDRVRFVRENVEHIPADLWAKMQSSKTERLDYESAEILLHVTSKAERKRLRACAKEPFTVQWIERMVCPGDVFYDIGANVGTYSLIAAKKTTGAARVFAFEASMANMAALCGNVVLNALAADVTPLAVALSNTNGLGHFHLRELEPGSAKHMLEADSPDGPTLYVQPVIKYRLDDLITLLRLPPPNHIKLDVDGCEIEVLEGAGRTLESAGLKTMLVEVSTELSDAVAEFVEARGLKLRRRINVKSKSGVYRVWYGLFARETEELFPFDLSGHPALVLAD